MDDSTVRPLNRDDVILRQLDEEWVIYDPRSQEIHVLNRTAALVWLYCTGDNTQDAIVDALGKVFGDQVLTVRLEQDVAETITKFESLRLFA